MATPTRSARLSWSGEGRVYRGAGAAADAPVTLDGDATAGPSPMETLLLSLAGCMLVDIQMILEKGRVPLEGLEARMTGERAPEPPRRFTRIVMDIHARGPGPGDQSKLDRAVELSRDKYCSVFHTLRPDIEVQIRTHRE
jgi:putative redox protein